MRSALTMPIWRIVGRAGGAAIEATPWPGDPFSLSWLGGRRGKDAILAESSDDHEISQHREGKRL